MWVSTLSWFHTLINKNTTNVSNQNKEYIKLSLNDAIQIAHKKEQNDYVDEDLYDDTAVYLIKNTLFCAINELKFEKASEQRNIQYAYEILKSPNT